MPRLRSPDAEVDALIVTNLENIDAEASAAVGRVRIITTDAVEHVRCPRLLANLVTTRRGCASCSSRERSAPDSSTRLVVASNQRDRSFPQIVSFASGHGAPSCIDVRAGLAPTRVTFS